MSSFHLIYQQFVLLLRNKVSDLYSLGKVILVLEENCIFSDLLEPMFELFLKKLCYKESSNRPKLHKRNIIGLTILSLLIVHITTHQIGNIFERSV